MKIKLYTVIYRQGGWARFRFVEMIPCGLEQARIHVSDLERMGYYTLIHKTDDLRKIGGPSRFESHYENEPKSLGNGWFGHDFEETK